MRAPGPAEVLLAHGIGGRQDLPLPLFFVVIGAAGALLVSFWVLGALWRRPVLGRVHHGRALPPGLARALTSPVVRVAVRCVGLLGAGWVGVAAMAGPDTANNPTAGAAYVLLWVAVPLASVLLGPVWRWVNPLRTLHLLLAKALRTAPEVGLLALPAQLGYWPAVIGLFAFAWLELVAPDRATLPVIRSWFLVYVGAHLIAASVYGSHWFDRGDAFEVFSDLAGHLAPIGRRLDGVLVLRNPLDGLAELRPAPGLVATAVVLLGTTAYDSVSSAPAWRGRVQAAESPVLVSSLALVATIAVVGVLFYAATLGAALAGASGGDRPDSLPRRLWPTELAHTIVPVALGYFLAHYYSLLVLVGQDTVIKLSDPLATGADWLGTGSRGVDDTLVTPTGVATLQVGAILAGHLLGVVAAHDRTMRLLPPSSAVRAQIPLLAVMMAYTVTGLLLLFAA